MNEKEFLTLLAQSSTQKSKPTFNLSTANVSKQAVAILKDTPYKALAKQHINTPIINAYNNNPQFKQKLDEVLAQLDIEVIA